VVPPVTTATFPCNLPIIVAPFAVEELIEERSAFRALYLPMGVRIAPVMASASAARRTVERFAYFASNVGN
jgi:hypothetical protein